MLLANVCNAAVLIVALWASPQHQLAITWASTTLVFTLYHGLKNRHSADTEAVVRFTQHDHSNGPQRPVFWQFVGNAASFVFLQCVARRPSYHRLPLRRCTGWRYVCLGQRARGSDSIHSSYRCCLCNSHRAQWRPRVSCGGGPDDQLHRGAMAGCMRLMPRRSPRELLNRFRLRARVRRDELTSLPNRLAFFEALEERVCAACSSARAICCSLP